jgi:hypothetical protein
MRKRLLFMRPAGAFLLCMAAVPTVFAQSPSTPEDRNRLITLTHKLESNPLDPSLRPEREWAIKWLIEVPDIHVGMCPSILGDYQKYKYSAEITTQLMLESAEFVIKNPDQARDRVAQYVAAAEGALKAYGAILQQDPKAKSKALDDLVQKKSAGKLNESIQDVASKGCRN